MTPLPLLARFSRTLALLPLIFAASALAADPVPPAQATTPPPKGLRVATCGNSFHAWFIAPILKDMAEKAGIHGHTIVCESKIGGSESIQHWDVPDAENKAKAALKAGKADVLTLAGMHHPDEGIDKFAELGIAHNPQFRVSYQEFWIPWDRFVWPYEGSPDEIDFDAATPASLKALHEPYFKEMDAYVAALNRKLGKQVVCVAPVGQAVVALREKVAAGQIDGIARQSELFTDKLGHPELPLAALVSYVHFAVIYRQSPVGLPVPAILAEAPKEEWRSAKLNRQLQEIAWEAVKNHPLSGVSEPAPAKP